MAVFGNKDKEFWESLKRWNVIIILIETWIDEKNGIEQGRVCRRVLCEKDRKREKRIRGEGQ